MFFLFPSQEMFRNPHSTFHVEEMYLQQDEVSIAGILNDADARFKDKVILGSYPDFYNRSLKISAIFRTCIMHV